MRALFGLVSLLVGLGIFVVSLTGYQNSTTRLAEINEYAQIGGGLGRLVINLAPDAQRTIQRLQEAQTVNMGGMAAGGIFALLGVLLVAIPEPSQPKPIARLVTLAPPVPQGMVSEKNWKSLIGTGATLMAIAGLGYFYRPNYLAPGAGIWRVAVVFCLLVGLAIVFLALWYDGSKRVYRNDRTS